MVDVSTDTWYFSLMNGTGIELRYTQGTSNKYWRALLVGTTLITQYGRIGSDGQITVHHLGDPTWAADKAYGLIRSKRRKGYQVHRGVSEFPVADVEVDRACSTNSTGNGGVSPAAARSICRAWDAFDQAARYAGSRDVRAIAAAHPDNAYIKALVALDQRADADLLTELADDPDARVQDAVGSRVVEATLAEYF